MRNTVSVWSLKITLVMSQCLAKLVWLNTIMKNRTFVIELFVKDRLPPGAKAPFFGLIPSPPPPYEQEVSRAVAYYVLHIALLRAAAAAHFHFVTKISFPLEEVWRSRRSRISLWCLFWTQLWGEKCQATCQDIAGLRLCPERNTRSGSRMSSDLPN